MNPNEQRGLPRRAWTCPRPGRTAVFGKRYEKAIPCRKEWERGGFFDS